MATVRFSAGACTSTCPFKYARNAFEDQKKCFWKKILLILLLFILRGVYIVCVLIFIVYLCTYLYCFVVILLFCVFLIFCTFCCCYSCFLYFFVLCIFIFVCTSVELLPPGESSIAVSNNNIHSFISNLSDDRSTASHHHQ
jgi:hypothetical protein